MPMTQTNLITRIEEFYIRGDVTDAVWQYYLDFALEEAEKRFIFRELKTLASYTLAISTNSITLNANWRAVYYVYYLDSSNNQRRITPRPLSEFERDLISGSNSTGPPRIYTIWGSTMLFEPYSDVAYSIRTREARYSGTPFTTGNVGTTTSPVARLDLYLIRFAVGMAYQAKGLKDLSDENFKWAEFYLKGAIGAGTAEHIEGAGVGSGGYEMSR